MAKVRQIAKEQLKELREQGRKEGKEHFFTKNYKYFRYPWSQCRLKYEALQPYGMGFYGLQRLKFFFPNMSNQLQDPTPHLSSCLSLCYHASRYFFETRAKRVSLKYHPLTFDNTLFYRWLAVFDVRLNTSCRRGNICYMEHLGHGNLSLCVLSTFSTYHGHIYLLLVLLPVFRTAVAQPHSKFFLY